MKKHKCNLTQKQSALSQAMDLHFSMGCFGVLKTGKTILSATHYRWYCDKCNSDYVLPRNL